MVKRFGLTFNRKNIESNKDFNEKFILQVENLFSTLINFNVLRQNIY